MEVAPGPAALGVGTAAPAAVGSAARWVDAGVVSGAQALLGELAAAAQCPPASGTPGWRNAAAVGRPPPGPAGLRLGGAEGGTSAAGAAPPHPLSPREQPPAAPGELPTSLSNMDRAALKSIGDELAQLRSADLRELSIGVNSLKLVGELPLGSMDMRELLAWLPAFLGDDPPPLESLPPEVGGAGPGGGGIAVGRGQGREGGEVHMRERQGGRKGEGGRWQGGRGAARYTMLEAWVGRRERNKEMGGKEQHCGRPPCGPVAATRCIVLVRPMHASV